MLLQRGWDVTVLVRKPESAEARAIQSLGAQLAHGDITDCESMREPMTGAHAVIHNAAWYEFGITRQAQNRMRTINVRGTENALGLALELGIPKIVYTSTILAFGPTGDTLADETFQRRSPPLSCYERTKTEAYELAVALQKRGAPIVIACPAGVIGPGDRSALGYLVRMYVRGFLPPVLWEQNGRRAHVYVEDAAEGILRCLEYGKAGETYILSNGVMRHRDMIRLWKQTPGGFKVTLFWMPYPIWRCSSTRLPKSSSDSSVCQWYFAVNLPSPPLRAGSFQPPKQNGNWGCTFAAWNRPGSIHWKESAHWPIRTR